MPSEAGETPTLPGGPRIAWAFVPPTPKALTPANGLPSGHGSGVVGTRKGPFAQSTCGLPVVKCSVGGMTPWCRARVVLMRPATPAALSTWPMFVFTEPSAHIPLPVTPPARKAGVSPVTSMGSPRGVPVPWAST